MTVGSGDSLLGKTAPAGVKGAAEVGARGGPGASRFDLFTLQLFVDVVERRSIGKGAVLNFVTVSAASKRIADMERMLGVQLLQRGARGVSATEAGNTLYKGAVDTLARLQQLTAAVTLHGQVAAQPLRVFSNLVSLSHDLPAALKAFADAHPDTPLSLTEQATDATLQALVRGQADVGIVTPIQAYPAPLMAFRYGVIRHVLAVPENHALAGRSSVRFDDAAAFDLVGLEREGGWDRLQQQVAQERGLTLRVRARVSSFDSMCRMAGGGLGVAIVPLGTAQVHAASCGLKLLPLSEPWAEIPLDVCWRQQPEPPEAVRRLLAHLKPGASVNAWPGNAETAPVSMPRLNPRPRDTLAERLAAVPIEGSIEGLIAA